MHTGSLKFVKNAFSNLVAGGASAIMAVVLPYYFVRDFSHDEFSLWVLVLQLAAYVNFLNFGVQIAVGRYVAHALSRDDQAEAEDILTAGLQILTVLAGAAFLLLMAISFLLPVAFTKINPAMLGTARSMLFWIGGALTLGLPFSAYFGVFVGLQRNDIPATISLVSKAGLAVALIWTAGRTHNLETVAQVYFAVSLIGYLLQYIFFKIVCPNWRLRLASNLPVARKEVISYCLSLTVWSVSMLLVNGIGTTIVGIYDFKSVAAFGVALNIITFFVGLFRAIISPLLQVFAKLHARHETARLISLFEFSSYVTSILLMIVSCWMVLPAQLLFRLWIGPQMALVSVPLFIILVFANAIRNSATPYANYLLAIGEQRKVYLSPFAEGVSNFVTSIIGAALFGATGVAWGVFAGAIVGVAANYFYNFRRTLPPGFSKWHYFRQNIADPLALAIPMLLVFWLGTTFGISFVWTIPAMILATIPSLFQVWRAYRGALGDLKTARAEPALEEPLPGGETI